MRKIVIFLCLAFAMVLPTGCIIKRKVVNSEKNFDNSYKSISTDVSNSDLLPIGSVVLLEGGKKKLMITGRYMSDAEDASKIYDYSAILYPEGIISADNYLFNNEQIVKVYYYGYIDEDEIELRNTIIKLKLSDDISKGKTSFYEN